MWGTIIDIVLIAIVVFCAVVGIIKGFFDSILGLIGTTLAFIAGVFLAKYIAPIVNNIFGLENFLASKINLPENFSLFGTPLNNAEVAKFGVWVITVLAVFLVVKLVIFILGKIFESVTNNSPAVSGINRVLGMVFGIVKGAITVVLVIMVASLLGKIPGVGDTIDAKINETKICKWADKYVDDIMEKYITKDNLQDIIDRIISDNKAENNDNTDTNASSGDNITVANIKIISPDHVIEI